MQQHCVDYRVRILWKQLSESVCRWSLCKQRGTHALPHSFSGAETVFIMMTYSSESDSDSRSRSSQKPPSVDRKRRQRLQYAGIALVAIAYIGGLIWWTYASMNIETPRDSGFAIPADPVLKTSVEVQAPTHIPSSVGERIRL